MGTDPTRAKHQTIKNLHQGSLLLKQRGMLFPINNTEISADCNCCHSSKTTLPKRKDIKCLKAADRFIKDPPAVEKTYNCKRHTDNRHQNIAHSQCCYEYVGNRALPVVMVHGAKNEEISKDGHNIGNSKQNCFSPNKGFCSHSKLMEKCVGDHHSRPMNKKTGTATALETLKVQVSWETVELRRWESITG